MDITLEIGTSEKVIDMLTEPKSLGARALSQESNLKKVGSLEVLPTSYGEDNLFLMSSSDLNWERL
jgi:hypothetical protein